MTKTQLKMVDLRLYAVFEKLLKEAMPTREKRHYLMKLLLQESPEAGHARLQEGITAFYRLKYAHRTEKAFRRIFGIKPYPWLLGEFFLTFRTANVSETAIFQTATHLRFVLGGSIPMPEPIGSVEFLHLTVYHTVKPRPDRPATGITLAHFIDRWREQAFRKHGDAYDGFFANLIETLEGAKPEAAPAGTPISIFKSDLEAEFTDDAGITQTDLDWMRDVRAAIEGGEAPPPYPLASGPKVPVLLRIEKLVRAARRHHPFRHKPLEDAVLRCCHYYLNTYGQPADNKVWLGTK